MQTQIGIVPPHRVGIRPDSFFASNTSGLKRGDDLRLLQTLGIKVQRAHFNPRIVSVPATPGGALPLDFSIQDAAFAEARARETWVLPIAGYAFEGTKSKLAIDAEMHGPPRDNFEFVATWEQILRRYPQISTVEFWNEPWIFGWTWAGTPQQYRDLQTQWTRMARRVNPRLRLLAGNTALSTLDLMFANRKQCDDTHRIQFLPREESFIEELQNADAPWVHAPSGAIEADHYTPVFAVLNLRDQTVRDFWLRRWREANERIGLEGIFLDSSFNLSSDKFSWRALPPAKRRRDGRSNRFAGTRAARKRAAKRDFVAVSRSSRIDEGDAGHRLLVLQRRFGRVRQSPARARHRVAAGVFVVVERVFDRLRHPRHRSGGI